MQADIWENSGTWGAYFLIVVISSCEIRASFWKSVGSANGKWQSKRYFRGWSVEAWWQTWLRGQVRKLRHRLQRPNPHQGDRLHQIQWPIKTITLHYGSSLRYLGFAQRKTANTWQYHVDSPKKRGILTWHSMQKDTLIIINNVLAHLIL